MSSRIGRMIEKTPPRGIGPRRPGTRHGRQPSARSWRWWWRCRVAAPDEPVEVGSELNRLEAVLFLAREPLPARRIAQVARLADGRRVRGLVRELNARYDTAHTAFHVVEVAGGFQLRTRPPFARWIRRLPHVPPPLRLSSPALETLAVVAYRQPVIRAEIESIRGVHCGEMLRQLMERDLVRICGRSDDLGRPFLYATTKKFLEVFGLRSLDLLPEVTIFQNSLAASDASVDVVTNDLGEGDDGGGSD